MFVKTVNLWENTPGMCEEVPFLDIYVPENKTSDTAVVILPGGGYAGVGMHVGKSFAEFLNEHGITAFVCKYRVSPHQFPLPLLDARRALRYVRYHSAEYGIHKKKVYMMGSSAGGHLTALTSTYYEPIPELEGLDEIDKESGVPNGQILCYPVIALLGKGVTHFGSGKKLLGERHAELGEELSPHLIATEKAPKAFIWHTFADAGVNMINSLEYAKRLRQVGVSTELHIYPDGRHGSGLAKDVPHTCNWPKELLGWIALNEDRIEE